MVVATGGEAVVLAEPWPSASVSIPVAGAAAIPLFVGLVAVELAEVAVVATLLLPSEATDATATLGTAVHRRPSRVVTKAPEGKPLDAILGFHMCGFFSVA